MEVSSGFQCVGGCPVVQGTTERLKDLLRSLCESKSRKDSGKSNN